METLVMSEKSRVRLDALSRVKRRELTLVAAASLMEVSLRQARRLWKQFKARGAGQGKGGAEKRGIPGPPGQGAQAAWDLGHGAGQWASGEVFSRGSQPAFCGGAPACRGHSPAGARIAGRNPVRSGTADGGPRLVRALAGSVPAVGN